MRDLIICGVGEHSPEVIEIVERINLKKLTWKILGFLAQKKAEKYVGGEYHGIPVLGLMESIGNYPEAYFAVSNSFGDIAPLPVERIVTLIDPSAVIAKTARIGRGCIIYPNCFVGHNAVIGNRVFMLSGSVINHDDHIEDGVIIASGISAAGYVHVESDTYLGQACSIRQGVRIGKSSLIGMGCVVLKDVEPYSVMVGNPARLLRKKEH